MDLQFVEHVLQLLSMRSNTNHLTFLNGNIRRNCEIASFAVSNTIQSRSNIHLIWFSVHRKWQTYSIALDNLAWGLHWPVVSSIQRYIMVSVTEFGHPRAQIPFALLKHIFRCWFFPRIRLVDGGHRAVIFDRFQGIKPGVVGEGTHFFVPWVQRPIIFDIRSQPRNVPVVTGSKDLQNVNITLRILFRPVPDQLPRIYTTLGQDYDDRVLPSITTEVLKAVVAQFDAGELITQREVSI